MRYWFGWLEAVGLLLLCAGCLSTPRSLPPNTPTVLPPITATNAATVQRVSATPPLLNETQTPTQGVTETPTDDSTAGAPGTAGPLMTRVPDACTRPASQMSVSFVDSSVLARRVPYTLYLPPCYDTSPDRLYPVLYLLHGANTDHTQWPDLNVQPDADSLINQAAIAPLVVVMPGGDYRQGEDYGSFVLRDLIPHVEQTLHVATDGKHRAIGGLSQGGYWALDLALAHPDRFSAVGGHSAATSTALTDLLASNRISQLKTLRIYLDVGNDDPLAAGVEAFAAALQAHGLAPILHIYPGAHNRPYWRSHTSEYLTFYAAGW